MELFVRQTRTKLIVWDISPLFLGVGLIFAIAGSYLTISYFSVATLTCQRESPTPGDCEFVKLGLHPPQVQGFPLDTLQEAIVRERFAGRGSSYHLSLLTSRGEIPFPETPFRGKKYSIASQINDFIQTPNHSFLKVSQDERLDAFWRTLLFWGIGLVCLLFMNDYFEIVTCSFDRNRGVMTLQQRNILKSRVIEHSTKEIDSVVINVEKQAVMIRNFNYIYFDKYRLVVNLKSGEPFWLTWHNTKMSQGKRRIVHYINKYLRNFKESQENVTPQHNLVLEQSTQQHALEQEITMWHKAILSHPDNAEAHYRLGLAFYRHHQRPEAVKNLQRARELFHTEGNTKKAAEVQDFLWQSGLE